MFLSTSGDLTIDCLAVTLIPSTCDQKLAKDHKVLGCFHKYAKGLVGIYRVVPRR